MTRNIQLLVIDPQNDFCDLPAAWQPTNPLTGARTAPSLPVSGGAVVLHGPNGAGKTNLLEAISLLTPGKGLRGALGRKRT